MTKWLEVSVATSLLGRELLQGALDGLGFAPSEWLQTEAEMQNALQENRAGWDYVNEEEIAKTGTTMGVRLFFRDDAIGHKQLDSLYALLQKLQKQDFGFDLGSLTVTLHSSEEDDWAQAWKRFYHPFPIGSRLWIKPAWEEAESPAGKLVLAIDPGMIFGTGGHATTRLCLEQLEKTVRSGDTLLDLGCGSGILWIAALLLGAKKTLGVDIDPHTQEINRHNAELNGLMPDRYGILLGDLCKEPALANKIGTGVRSHYGQYRGRCDHSHVALYERIFKRRRFCSSLPASSRTVCRKYNRP